LAPLAPPLRITRSRVAQIALPNVGSDNSPTFPHVPACFGHVLPNTS
jgi:hypothetical protein